LVQRGLQHHRLTGSWWHTASPNYCSCCGRSPGNAFCSSSHNLTTPLRHRCR
jgi:hypothetical protein